jgi:hypothetical protein
MDARREATVPAAAWAPLKVRGGNFYAPARIGGVTYPSLLDTGSREAVVSGRLAARFRTYRTVRMRGRLGVSRVRSVRLPRLDFLGKTYPDLRADGRPPSSDAVLSWRVLLGTRVLLDRPLILDLERMRVGAGLPRGPAPRGAHAPLGSARGWPVVRARFGRRPVLALLDTGSPRCALSDRATGVRATTVGTEPVFDVTGARAEEPYFRGPTLRIGPWDLGDVDFFRFPMRHVGQGLGIPVDFVLGANALLAAGGTWTLDRRRGSLAWTK